MRQKISGSDANKTGAGALDGFRSDNGSHIARLYDMYRGEFIAFARKHFSLGEDDAIEVYQESFIALYENAKNGKLTSLSVSLKTYLFRIARNKILNRRRDAAGKSEPLTDHPEITDSDWEQKQKITYDLVQEMEEPCNTVLTLFYWERRSMEYIAGAMNYASSQVAKNRKSVCLRKLKEVLTRRFTAEGLM